MLYDSTLQIKNSKWNVTNIVNYLRQTNKLIYIDCLLLLI